MSRNLTRLLPKRLSFHMFVSQPNVGEQLGIARLNYEDFLDLWKRPVFAGTQQTTKSFL